MNYWDEEDELTDSQVYRAAEEEDEWEGDEQLLCDALDEAMEVITAAVEDQTAVQDQTEVEEAVKEAAEAETTQLVNDFSQLDLWQQYNNAVEVQHLDDEPSLTQMIRDAQPQEPSLTQMMRDVEPQTTTNVAVDWWESPMEQPVEEQPTEQPVNNRPMKESTRRALQQYLAKKD